MWPFKKEPAQRAFSLIITLTGLVLIAISINQTIILNVGSATISYTAIGLVLFLAGLIYFVESTFK